MKNQLSLEVAKPCLENFNQFTTTSKGGYCDSCTKEVIDFTIMKDEQIINYFETNSGIKTCGRFKNHQLKTYNQSIKLDRKLRFASRIAIACLALFSFGTIQAQKNKAKSESQKNVAIQIQNLIVKGNVSDGTNPIPGVNIILQGSTIGTVTDGDGNFAFPKKLKKGDALIFSYLGYKSQKVVMKNESSAAKIDLKLDMELDEVVIMGDVATKRVYKSRN